MMSSVSTESKLQQAVSLQGVDPETCMIVFKNHWAQVVKILEKHDPLKNTQAKYGSIPPDEASAVQNYVEHMIFLLIEEQAKDAAMGPILEFVVSENVMEKLFLWSLRREFTDETKIEQLRMYEMLVTQSHQPLLHHKPILKPLMMLLSSCSGTAAATVEGKLVVLLNQLCSILAKDPSILELFFHTSEDQGAANFLIFSLLIPFIHREGTVGQQARDALLFIMSLSAENTMVAHHIVENTYFCPVLATGLSGLYSSLPTKLEEKGEEWHCLLKDDWLLLPSLVQFMNSLEFCNAVIQVAHPLIRSQLVSYIYNGFLVPVLAPALHKQKPNPETNPLPCTTWDLRGWDCGECGHSEKAEIAAQHQEVLYPPICSTISPPPEECGTLAHGWGPQLQVLGKGPYLQVHRRSSLCQLAGGTTTLAHGRGKQFQTHRRGRNFN